MKQYSQNQILNLKLAWNNLSLIEKNTQKLILNNLNGQVKTGQFLTIMGSSGAGKSSFLSLVTKTLKSEKTKFITKGNITINNKQYLQNQFFSIASYVPQDDILLEALTVKQTLDFQAQLKLYHLTEGQKQSKVIQILKLLNLHSVKDSFIGGSQTKSISGGQKKRVAIGVQLISDPAFLILDEPTSGLDSVNSLKIIKILSKLSKQQNKLIITTIHQPSTLMFQSFDKLMLMRNGSQIFLENAQFVVLYMKNLGIKVDDRMNPADFVMLEISAYKQQSQGYKTPITNENFDKYLKSKNKQIRNYEIYQQEDDKALQIKISSTTFTPVVEQFKILYARNLKCFIRSPSNKSGKILQILGISIIISLLFYDIIRNAPDLREQKSVQTFLGEFVSFLFIGMLATFSQTVYDTILVFPSQKQLVLKQANSNMYYLSVYYITKLLVQVPIALLYVIVSHSIMYSIIGMKNDWEHWLLYLFVMCVIAGSGYVLGIITGLLCKNKQIAIQALPLLMMPMITYGGQIVNLSELPWYSFWIQYVTPLRYGFNIIVKNQLQTSELLNLGDDPSILKQLGLQGSLQQNMTQILLLAYSFIMLSFLLLYMRKKIG